MSHAWIIRFLEHRIADKRILRLIAKWLKVGIIEDGRVTRSQVGAPQGEVISPTLANVYCTTCTICGSRDGAAPRRTAM
jgi:RNA-directed DNA polymerase